jgi:hypothetical protein
LEQHGAVQKVLVHLVIYDRDDVRGALKPDSQGRAQRGNLEAVKRLMEEDVCK